MTYPIILVYNRTKDLTMTYTKLNAFDDILYPLSLINRASTVLWKI